MKRLVTELGNSRRKQELPLDDVARFVDEQKNRPSLFIQPFDSKLDRFVFRQTLDFRPARAFFDDRPLVQVFTWRDVINLRRFHLINLSDRS